MYIWSAWFCGLVDRATLPFLPFYLFSLLLYCLLLQKKEGSFTVKNTYFQHGRFYMKYISRKWEKGSIDEVYVKVSKSPWIQKFYSI